MHMRKHAQAWTSTATLDVEPPRLLANDKVAKVYLRCRPLLPHEGDALSLFYFPPSSDQIHVVTPSNRWSGGRFATKAFLADRVFGMEDSNEDVYRETKMESFVKELMEVPKRGKGCDTLVIAYGQTGTGKTFTMTALEDYVIADIFKSMPSLDPNTRISLSAFEIRQDGQNHAFDLLSTPSLQPVKILGGDAVGETTYIGLSSHDVWTEEDLKILIHRAASERRTRSTVKNDTSSRSHAVIHLTVLHPVPGQESVASRFTMIDLAGFERSEYLTKNRSQDRVKESIETNKSLAALKVTSTLSIT
ncbi:P-loop containing nucleoside triphosphate hydrolase protein [Atractiella rhizophila]|nr:P-loop containing nucleoside triphosphate hydrolase protein [Atractiella rhizophila]